MDLDVATVADDVHAISLADGAVGVDLASEIDFVFPGGVAPVPVHAVIVEAVDSFARVARSPGDLSIGVAIGFARERQRNRFAVLVVARDENEIAHSAFDNLCFDRSHPDAAVGTIGADAMNEQT